MCLLVHWFFTGRKTISWTKTAIEEVRLQYSFLLNIWVLVLSGCRLIKSNVLFCIAPVYKSRDVHFILAFYNLTVRYKRSSVTDFVEMVELLCWSPFVAQH